MLFKWGQLTNGAKNSETEASMANPLTSKVVIAVKGHLLPTRPAMKSILVLVPVNFKTWRFLNIEFTWKVPVTSVSLRSTSHIFEDQVPKTATSPAILVLERRTQRSLATSNASRFPLTLLFDRSRDLIPSGKAARSPVTKVFRRKRRSILVQLAKTAKSPEILVSLKSSHLKSLSSLKLWLKVPCTSLRPLKRISSTLHSVLYLDRCQQVSFKSKHRIKRGFFQMQHVQYLWKESFVHRRVDVYLRKSRTLHTKPDMNSKSVCSVCTTCAWSIPFLILSFQNCQGTHGNPYGTNRHLPPFLCL